VKIDSKRVISLVEHYAYATFAAGLAIWQSGNHNIKEVAWAALIGVLGPVIAHFNPKSLVNDVSKVVKLNDAEASILETATATILADVKKTIDEEATKTPNA
jgi:hypothetical protein